MKRCPKCNVIYNDETLNFCLDDGEWLQSDADGEPATAILHSTDASGDAATRNFSDTTDQTVILPNEAPSPVSQTALRRNSLLAGLIGILLVAVLGIGGYWFYGRGSDQINSIAVMPFVNESGNPDVEYLSDGMTETLIGSLTKVPDLNVKARSSVFRYKGKETDAKTLGSELNVQAILNGRVAQRGDQLTVSLELVDVATENAIWSQQYTRKQTDLVSLQSEIARDVSNNLKSRLSGADVAKVQKTYTADPEAYQLYLKGRFQWNRRTGESLKLAVAFFEQAIAKDPNYALAYSALAETYALFPNYSVALPMDCMPKAKAAALKAIELDDSLAEAHVALGIYYSNFAWNLPASEKEFRRAIELNPNYAYAHHQFGIECLSAAGRSDEAIAAGKRAEELDPVSPIIGADLGLIFIRARRYDEAIAQLSQVAALDPDFWVTSWYLGFAHYGKKQYAEAVAAHRKALSASDNPVVKAYLIQSLVKAGQRGEATELLAALQAESERRYVPSSSLAIAYGALGEKDKAFLILEKEVADRAARPLVFSLFVIWDDLRDDPRFAALIRKVEQSKLD